MMSLFQNAAAQISCHDGQHFNTQSWHKSPFQDFLLQVTQHVLAQTLRRIATLQCHLYDERAVMAFMKTAARLSTCYCCCCCCLVHR
jgi:hypothetical protein